MKCVSIYFKRVQDPDRKTEKVKCAIVRLELAQKNGLQMGGLSV